jgi:hypothetical protein
MLVVIIQFWFKEIEYLLHFTVLGRDPFSAGRVFLRVRRTSRSCRMQSKRACSLVTTNTYLTDACHVFHRLPGVHVYGYMIVNPKDGLTYAPSSHVS